MRHYVAGAEERRSAISGRVISNRVVALVLSCSYADGIAAGESSIDQKEAGKEDVKHR